MTVLIENDRIRRLLAGTGARLIGTAARLVHAGSIKRFTPELKPEPNDTHKGQCNSQDEKHALAFPALPGVLGGNGLFGQEKSPFDIQESALVLGMECAAGLNVPAALGAMRTLARQMPGGNRKKETRIQ